MAAISGGHRIGPLALGDVPRPGGNADDVPGQVADRRYGDGDVDQAAVLVDALGLMVLCALSCFHALLDPVDLIKTIWRQQERDVLSDRFVSCVAVQALARRGSRW